MREFRDDSRVMLWRDERARHDDDGYALGRERGMHDLFVLCDGAMAGNRCDLRAAPRRVPCMRTECDDLVSLELVYQRGNRVRIPLRDPLCARRHFLVVGKKSGRDACAAGPHAILPEFLQRRWMSPSARPLYAIGDVHGDVERLLKLLVAHDIIETSEHTFEWKKANIVVLLMGDVLDAKALSEGFGDLAFQGTTSDLWILEFLVIASEKASRVGSSVHALAGEHEVRNIKHDFSGASPYHLRDPAARARYFSPGGNGQRALNSVFLTSIVYNRTVYAHAGLPLSMSGDQKSLIGKRIGAQILSDARRLDALAGIASHNDYGHDPSVDEQETLETMLRRRGLSKMVVGHYFTRGHGIFAGWNGRVIYTDVGISRAYMPTATRESSTVLLDSGTGDLRILDLSGETREIPEMSAKLT